MKKAGALRISGNAVKKLKALTEDYALIIAKKAAKNAQYSGRKSIRSEDVEEAVKETIAKASPGGGHIMASSNSIHPGVNPENYKAMVEATRRYGEYLIDEDLIKNYKSKKIRVFSIFNG